MTDFLLVHGAGQGAWSWGQVWGYLTAPEEHPPRLHAPKRANKVYPMDLPGHGADADGDTGEVRLEECIHSITRAVEREGLKDLVQVGHGFAGGLVLQAISQLPQPPKRLVLVAGIVPVSQRSMLSAMPQSFQGGFRMLTVLSKFSRQDCRYPKAAISRLLCNGMDPMEVVHAVGFFGPLPTRVLTSRISLDDGPPPCPVTYVVLTQDKLLPAKSQEKMANRIPDVEVVSLDSCHEAMLYKPKELADILIKYAQLPDLIYRLPARTPPAAFTTEYVPHGAVGVPAMGAFPSGYHVERLNLYELSTYRGDQLLKVSEATH